MYAIIQEGGRQFKVTSGDTIRIDRQVDEGVKDITFSEVLFVGGEGTPKIGTPIVAGATVTADVVGPVKGPKVLNVRYRRRKGFHKTVGHRQQYLAVKVTGINA